MAILDAAQNDPTTVALTVLGVVTGSLLVWGLSQLLAQPPLPAVNYSSLELSYTKAKQKFAAQAKQIIASGLATFRGRPFCVVAEHGPKIILPGSAIDEVNKMPALDFHELTRQEFFGHLPGFEPFTQPPDNLIPNLVRIKITQSLTRFMSTLSAEMTEILQEQWGDSTEWQTRNLRQDMLRIISRLSARVFVGPELYHNEEWLRIAVDFAVTAMVAAREVRMWPAALRPIVHWFLPSCAKLRKTVDDARRLVGPIIEQRRAARAAGKVPPREDEDCIDWFDQMSDGKIPYDPVYVQLGLALASIHTTSDLLSQSMINMCLFPEWVQPLRKEAHTVIEQNGLTKAGMHQLQMLDSVLKETQRLKPPSITTLDRLAVANVKLADGTFVPKGTAVSISSHHLWDSSIHQEPDTFDPNRFLIWRNTPGREHKSHLVSTSVDHPAFGHGKHACPGRFFAANESKIALIHIFLKYDFELAAEFPKPTPFGVPLGGTLMPDPRAMIRVRRRQEEVKL